MRLSEIVGAQARDGAGHRLGTVVDVRFTQQEGSAPALVALLISPRSSGSFLGYERRSVDAPALIARYLRWRHRGAFLVRWADVRRVGDGWVEVRDGYRRFAAALP